MLGRRLVVAVTLAVMLTAAPVSAGAAVIEGYVSDADTGQPLQHATVWLHQVSPVGAQTYMSTAAGYFGFNPPFVQAGRGYHIRVLAMGGRYRAYGTYQFLYTGSDLDFDLEIWPRAHRVWGSDRFTTADQIARTTFGSQLGQGWPHDIDHVVIASGDDRAAADPLTAAGICWAYDAPLLLVSASHTPMSVRRAIKEITDDHGPVQIHVVGGPVSVPYERYQEIVDYVGDPTRLAFDRVAPYGDRYELAESIAARMRFVSDTTPKAMTDIVLIANGADSTKFFDALALSPITANTGSPILLVAQDSVPGSTRDAVGLLTPTRIIVGGGPATVGDGVVADLGAERWWGPDRYTTAADIANRAVSEGALDDDLVGVAAKLPDALTGGAMIGLEQGPLLLTQTDRVPSATYNFIAGRPIEPDVLLFGGPVSATEDVRERLWEATD